MFQEELFVATKRFVIIKDLEIRVAECTPNEIFEDNVLKIKYVPITQNPQEISQENGPPQPHFQDDTTFYYAHECKFEIAFTLNKKLFYRHWKTKKPPKNNPHFSSTPSR